MDETCAERAGVLAKAVRLAGTCGLTVLDRDCEAGGHRLDLVAVTSERVLVAVEVVVAGPEGVRAGAAGIGAGRVLETLHAGAAWRHAQGEPYDDLLVIIVVLSPDGPGQVSRGQGGDDGGAAL